MDDADSFFFHAVLIATNDPSRGRPGFEPCVGQAVVTYQIDRYQEALDRRKWPLIVTELPEPLPPWKLKCSFTSLPKTRKIIYRSKQVKIYKSSKKTNKHQFHFLRDYYI